MLKQIFDSFDLEKKGEIAVDMIGQILDMLGHQLSPEDLQVTIFFVLNYTKTNFLQQIVSEIDADGNGVMNFDEFAHLAARFVVEEEEDTEAILRELKDAFRLYDKTGLGYISVDLLREILKELDEKLTPADLEQMIQEIDTDGSGTVDWEGWYYRFFISIITVLFLEFKAMMMG